MSFRTGIGTSDADSITLMGRDLASELMGKVTLTELAFLLVQGRMPSPEETRLFDAVLVSLADHGLTPTVLAARLTYTGAPESIQGAVAAGLLGAGSVFLGVVEDTARFLDEIGDDVDAAVARARSRPAGASRASATRSTRCRTRARRGSMRSPRRPGSSGLTCARLREVAEAHREADRPRAADQRRRAWPAPRSPISASRRRCYAVSRCWRARRGCSATSPRRWSTRSGCLSTARWMSVRSTTRRLGSNGGGTATSEGRPAASTVPGGDAHAANPRALGPAECPCART